MIKFLQSGNRAAKYILAGFLLILAASMVVYLIPNFMSDTSTAPTGVVATVGGHDITRNEVARVLQDQARQQNIPPQFMGFMAQRAIQDLIQQAEITYEAERMGLSVSDKELRDDLQTTYKEAFFPDGKWVGPQQYKQLLQNYNLTVDQFENSVKQNLLRRKLFSVVAGNATVPESDVEQAYKDKNTKIKVQYAILSLDDVLKSIKPTETELKAYFEANQPRYQNAIPEKRQIKYFVINDKDVADQVKLDPAEVQNYYNSHQDSFKLPERVKLRHILIGFPPVAPGETLSQKAIDETRAKAEDVLKQVKAGGDFAALAKKYSTDPGSKDKGGELPEFTQGVQQLDPEFAKVAFAQAKGQTSGLVQSQFGFHIIRTEDRLDAKAKPLAEVKDDIEKLLKQDAVAKLENKISSEAMEDAQKEGLEKAAAKYHAQVLQSNMVTRTDSLAGIGAQPQFMDAVFNTQEKSGVQSARASNGYVFYEVTKVEPPRKPSFEEVRDQVLTQFKNERANELLRRKTEEMADRAHREHDLAKAAKEAGASVKVSELVGRTGVVPDLGSMSGPAAAAFNLKQGEISGPLNLGRNQGVLQVTERQDPSASDPQFAKERDQLRDQLLQQRQQEVLSMFMSDLSTRLEKEGKVKINKTEMENLTKSRS
ncbi:MAG TPA: peptidyl-prolyl cis-trans isomerase [Candidatus Angelobacter sp.]|nr:peptidyl-prolyl cis-trans isomerase [Candidatus Angelobacter sp.]